MAWNTAEEIGYIPLTTFWDDFSIAEAFGVAAIEDTYTRAFREWKDDVKYITELTMVLNHKIWEWHERNSKFCDTYYNLWSTCDKWCVDNLKGNDLRYFLETLD